MVQAIHMASKALGTNGRYMYPLTCLGPCARRHIHFADGDHKTRSLHVDVDWRPRSPRCLFQGKSLMTDEHDGFELLAL